MSQDEHQCSRTIVGYCGRLSAAQLGQTHLQISGAFAAAPCDQVDFQVGMTACANHGFSRHWRTPKIGVHDHPGAIDNRLQP